MIKKLIIAMACAIALAMPAAAKEKKDYKNTYALNRGLEAMNQGNDQDALDWLDKEISDNPDNPYAYLMKAVVYYENEHYGKALSNAQMSLNKFPKKDKSNLAVCHSYLGRIHLALLDTVSALNNCAEAIKLNPKEPSYFCNRGDIYYELEKYHLAKNDYLKTLALDESYINALMGLANIETNLKNYEEAIRQYTRIIKLYPNISRTYAFRGGIYAEQEKWNEAIDDFIKALEIDYDRWAMFSMFSLPDNVFPLLKSKLNIKVAKEGNNPYWLWILGYMYQLKDMYDEAIAIYEKCNDINATSGNYEKIAMCYLYKGDYAKAMKNVNTAINMDDSDNDLIMLKADILEHMGNYNDALTEMNFYVTKSPDASDGYLQRGNIKELKGDDTGAIEDYDLALAIDPYNLETLYRRGRLHYLLGNKEKADADNKIVAGLSGDTIGYSSQREHYALFFLGQKDKAIECIDKLLAQNKDRAGSYYEAACLYSLMNEKEKALDYLKQAVDKGYPHFIYMQADRDLENIRETPEFKAIIESHKPQREVANQEDNTARGIPIQEDNTARGIIIREDDSTDSSYVPFTKESGVTKVRCSINGLPLYFVFDTGAASVTMSLVEANFMLKNDYIKPSDVIGSQYFVDANGDISEGTEINLKHVDFGGFELNNVRASVVRNQKAPLLLGQSVLGRLGKIEIDNRNQRLKISQDE